MATHCYGLFVENGRIHDTDASGLRSALREVVETLRPELRLTPQQNILFTNLTDEGRSVFTAILDRWGVARSESLPNAIRHSMACPAYPTCGLAVAESERAMPSLIREIALVQRDAGVEDQRISYRMTGCPNGCTRPYLGDVGFVGTTLGKYDVFLGGDFDGTRLSELYMHNVKLEEIPRLLRGPLFEYARTQLPGEGFGDWCRRQGVDRACRASRPGGGDRVNATDLQNATAEDILAWTYRRFGRVALVASFQAESLVLIDLACKIVPAPEVLTLDTGRLHEETHDYIEYVRTQFPIRLRILAPEASELEAMTAEHGDMLFRKSVPAAQPVLRRAQGEPAGAGAARVRRVDHRAASRSDPDTRGDPGGRQRPRARRHDQGGAARGLEPRPGMGLPPRPRHPPASAV